MYPGNVSWATGEFQTKEEFESGKTKIEKRIEKLENKKSDSDIVFEFWYGLMRDCGPKTIWDLLKSWAIILFIGFIILIFVSFFFYYVVG